MFVGGEKNHFVYLLFFLLKGDAGFSLCWRGWSQSHWWESPVSNGHALVGRSLASAVLHCLSITMYHCIACGFLNCWGFPPWHSPIILKEPSLGGSSVWQNLPSWTNQRRHHPQVRATKANKCIFLWKAQSFKIKEKKSVCFQVWVWRHCGGEDFHTTSKKEGVGPERAVRNRKHFN